MSSNNIFTKNLPDINDVKIGFSHIKRNYFKGDPEIDDVHIHDYYELYINVSGSVSFIVGDAVYPIEKGDIILTFPHEFHHCKYIKYGEHEHYCLWFNSAASSLFKPFNVRSAEKSVKFSCGVDDKNKIIQILKRLEKDYAAGDEVNLLHGVLGLIVVMKNADELSGGDSESFPDTFKKIIDYINLHYTENINNKDIAEKNFISECTLIRLFHKHVHTTPQKYLTAKRLSHAQQLLSSGLSVHDACEKSGFSDYSHFIQLFKKEFAETPLKYKRINSEK